MAGMKDELRKWLKELKRKIYEEMEILGGSVVTVARLDFWGLKAECGSLGRPGSKWPQESS